MAGAMFVIDPVSVRVVADRVGIDFGEILTAGIGVSVV
jgi:hypothetical protein